MKKKNVNLKFKLKTKHTLTVNANYRASIKYAIFILKNKRNEKKNYYY